MSKKKRQENSDAIITHTIQFPKPCPQYTYVANVASDFSANIDSLRVAFAVCPSADTNLERQGLHS